MSLVNMMDMAAIRLMNVPALLATGTEDAAESAGNTFQVTGDNGLITGALSEEAGFGNVTTAMTTGGNAVVYILKMAAGFCGVVGFIIAGIKLMLGGAGTKVDAKGSLGWIVVGGIVCFGSIAIIGLIQGISTGLFG